MGGDTKVDGPELDKGVVLTEILSRGMIQGRVGDSPVLLICRGDKFFAVGAFCCHYGAPLIDGAVHGNEIRCPWHHASFDLATGEATRAPSLNSISAWTVEVRNGKVFVTSQKPAATHEVTSAAVPDNVIIVGAGAAGSAAAEMLRRRGFQNQVVLLGAEPHLPYDRPNLSKDYLNGNAPEEWIPLRNADFYRDQNIEIRTNARVVELSPKARTLTLATGETLSFAKCLLAMGAEPRLLTIPGATLPHVRYLRSLDDSRALIAHAGKAKKAVVVGSGFIGLETAASLKMRGLDVTILSNEELPLARILGKELGRYIADLYQTKGITFIANANMTSIDEQRVYLGNGTTLAADLVVAGIGVKPILDLAQKADLLYGGQLVVDEFLETLSPGIYAAGDIASVPDWRTGEKMRIEHWATAQRQGQVAALNMLGEKTPHRIVPFFWSQHFDTTLAHVGHASSWDQCIVDGSLSDSDATVAYLRDGNILALLTIGRDKISLAAEDAMERNDQGALKRLARIG
ncbi:MAG: FAD-dependent oxidoreductase [Oligoflexales bacterium]